MLSVGPPPTANGANKPPTAAPATRSGGKGKITRMMPSNLIDDGAQAERGAVSGARPPGQTRSLLLAGRHGNETVHFGKGIRVPRPVGAMSANGPKQWLGDVCYSAAVRG